MGTLQVFVATNNVQHDNRLLTLFLFYSQIPHFFVSDSEHTAASSMHTTETFDAYISVRSPYYHVLNVRIGHK